MNTGFSTESLSENEILTFKKNINISFLYEEPKKNPIDCFDVDENGIIAIGCSNSENKTVCIYTSDGHFKYGYRFNCSGSFGVELNENLLNIYFVRSDVAITVNPSGGVDNILKIKNTSENNSYWHSSVFSTKRKVGNSEYMLKNNIGIFELFASSYSQLIVTNSIGEENIIYDVSSTKLFNVAVAFVFSLVFICFIMGVVIWYFIKLKRNI